MLRGYGGLRLTICVAVTVTACTTDSDEPRLSEVQQGVAQIAISHITWGTIGLDSNNVTIGPNVFPVGVRIFNIGAAIATNLTTTFAFTTANANVSLDAPSTVTFPSLAPGASVDAYFNVRIARTDAAYNTSREFVVTVSGSDFENANSPAPREVFVEKLVSQNRNAIVNISGPTTVHPGDTATYILDASTATSGYEQVEAYLTLPTSIFQVLSTATTYTAPSGAINDAVYADACGWDPVPISLTYRSCIGPETYVGGKAGGTIQTTYVAKVIGTGTASVAAAVYDFSGSSYHYNSDFGSLSITVVSSSGPTAEADSYSTAEDTTLTVDAPGVLTNDSTPTGTLTAILVTQAAKGTVTLDSDGSFDYVPNANYHGPDSFTYKANNGDSDSEPATVTITVTPVNDNPDAVDDNATVGKNAVATAVPVLVNDTEAPDTDETLTITTTSQPSGGTVVITGSGTGLTFQPTTGFAGATTFTYTISDGNTGQDTATVTVEVNNTPPNAVGDSATVAEDAAATAIPVLENDSDANGDTLTISAVIQPSGGTVVITGSGTGLTFQPTPNFNGTTSFAYTISDGNDSNSAEVSVTVTPANDPPNAIDDTATVGEDAGATAIPVLENDTSAPDASETLTITAVTQPANGTVVITGGGTGLTFQPDPNFNGTTSFAYTISDGSASDTAEVLVTVSTANDPPDANNDTATVAEDAAATAVVVLTNDTTAPDANEVLSIIAVTQPGDGTVVITGGGTGLTFRPDLNFNGTTIFTYTISDGNEGTDTASVKMTVTPANDPPQAIDDTATVNEDAAAAEIDVLENDSSTPDGEEILTITSVAQSSAGVVVITGAGTGLTFQPAMNFNGTTAFAYTLSDGNGGSATATVTVTVAPTNDPPTATSDVVTVLEASGVIAIDVLRNDTDIDGDVLFVESVTQPGGGTVTITAGGGGVLFQPGAGFAGTTSFTYAVSDGHGGIRFATVTILVATADRDRDGVLDSLDNCPDSPNPDQDDRDRNGDGDSCDPDSAVRVSGGGCDAGGPNGAGALAMLGGLALAIGRRRRRAAAAAMVALAIAPAAVRADDNEPRNFSIERFFLAPDRNGLFNVDWAEHPGLDALDAAFVVGLVNDPLVLYQADENNDRMILGSLLETRATANLVVSIALHRRLSIGADLPLVIYQDRPSDIQLTSNGLESISSFGLGNLRVTPRFTVLTQDSDGVGFAVLAAVTLPTETSGDAYFGDHGVSVAPTLAISRRFGSWRTGLNLGYLARKQAQFLDLNVEDELFVRAGVGYDLPVATPIAIDATLSAATLAADFSSNVNVDHLEALLGTTIQVDRQVQLFGGAGTGLAHGFGTPDVRVMLGVRLTRGGGVAPPPPVEDPDRDKDGVLDVVDRCPAEAGIAELQGCPATDSDGDGIADHLDKCSAEAEDKDSFEDEDGCAELDNDKDGVVDVADRCPLEAGVEPNQGCPDPDGDADTVVDRLDNCPNESGPPDNAGCPRPAMVTIGTDKLEIVESVYFKLDKAIIEERSHELLDNVATVIVNHPGLKIQVEGHTDSKGNDAYNRGLSLRRARSVVNYLVGKGVDRARLDAKGFGETKPLADNRTAEGRAQNRRVVFTIIGRNEIENKQQGADDTTKEKDK